MSKPSPDEAQAQIDNAVQLVESTIESLGIALEQSRQPDGDGGERRYAIGRGSAVILIQVSAGVDGRHGRMRVVAPVVDMPAEERRSELYQRLLTLNANLRGGAFAITERQVIVVAERSVEDLDASEVSEIIRGIGAVADRFDDELAEAFGTTRATD